MGKTKTKIIDDSLPVEEVKKPQVSKAQTEPLTKAAQAKKPKDALAASLLEELNKEFGEVKPSYAPNSAEAAAKGEKASEGKQKKEQVDIKQEGAKAEKAGKKPDQKTRVKPRGKKYQEAIAQVDKLKKYPLKEAVELAQKSSYSKFVATLEVHINTNQKNVRGLITLPFAAGKKLKILAFGKDAKESGVDFVGSDEILAEIEKGKFGKGTKLDFDVIVTTPEWMGKLAKVARILGPKGLMPNPKNGTVTDNLEKVVKDLQGGKIEYKTEPNNQVVHLAVGKVNQPTEEIASNVKSLYQTIGKTKISKITISPTMGPGVKVDLASI